MKKAESADPLDRKFTLAQLAGKGIRGKYHERATMRTNLVKLDPEIARRFPFGQHCEQSAIGHKSMRSAR